LKKPNNFIELYLFYANRFYYKISTLTTIKNNIDFDSSLYGINYFMKIPVSEGPNFNLIDNVNIFGGISLKKNTKLKYTYSRIFTECDTSISNSANLGFGISVGFTVLHLRCFPLHLVIN
jgi:hypothetical protein